MLKLITASVVALSSLSFNPPVEVRVNPRIGIAPRSVTVFVQIEPHEDNRWLTIAMESGRFGRSSGEELPGIDAPKVRTRTYESMREGLYTVVVSLQRAGLKNPIVSTTEFCLSGPTVSCAE